MTRLWLALAGLALVLSGCSLLNLGDVPPQGDCNQCAQLNSIEPPLPCESWQCGPDNVCVVDLVDNDGDGSPLVVCALDERPGDCDDGDETSAPGLEELCDARDNDCDEGIDEGLVLETEHVADADPAFGLAWARRPGDPSEVLASFLGSASNTLIVLTGGATEELTLGEQAAVGGQTALAATASDLLVLYPDFDCGALRAGRFTDSLSVSEDALPRAGECDAPPVQDARVALASDRLALAIGWEGATAERAACGSTSSGTVGASVLTRMAGQDWTPRPTLREVGVHDGLGAAALLALDELDFVVARVEAGELVLEQLEVDPASFLVTVRELFRVRDCGAACGLPSLALLDVDGSRQLGVAFRAGSCDASTLQLLRFSPSFGGLDAIGEAETMARGQALALALAARPEEPSWAMAWSDAEAVRVERGPTPAGLGSLTMATPGRVTDRIRLDYGDTVTVLHREPNARAVVRGDLECLPPVPPAAEDG